MRIRTDSNPPSRELIDRILLEGASNEDKESQGYLLRRPRQSCFLDLEGRPLSPRERLITQYRNDGLILFLGAGVSVDSGIPSWPKLARDILLSSGVPSAEVDDVMRALPSYISQFELARQLFGTEKDLIGALYRELYKGIAFKNLVEKSPRKYEDQPGWPGWSEILQALERNETLDAIGKLLIVFDGEAPRRNPQIHAVLTTNADTLLELYCEAKAEGKRVVTMVDRASVGDDPDQIPIYHLHGTLDARGENLSRPAPCSIPAKELQGISDDLLPELVFRESEYYETIGSPTSFVNHTPQSLLRRLNALFVGTSLDDLNLRRWLHDSFRERVEHRARYLREFYWRRYPDAEYEARVASIRHFWIRPQAEWNKDGTQWQVPRGYVDRVMRNLGVQVIWCTDYADMRKCLDDVQKLGYAPEFGRRAAAYPN